MLVMLSVNSMKNALDIYEVINQIKIIKCLTVLSVILERQHK